jgi:hypothetical protein
MRTVHGCILFVVAALGCAERQPPAGAVLALPNPAVHMTAVTVPDLTGRPITPLADASRKASVLIFITTDCPVANGYAPEIKRITAEYEPRGVAVYLVHADADVTADRAAQHAKEYGYANTVLLDREQLLVKATGATVTPEAALLSPRGELLYLGRIDDRVADFGQKREVIAHRELRDALDAVLAGRPVPVARTKALGCYIPTPSPS